MARKRTTENDFLVTPAGANAPARRKAATRTKAKRSAGPVETPSTPAVSPQAAMPEAEAIPVVEPSREEIARLAYTYWEERGCQSGSAEEDWARAEQALRLRAAVATA